MTNYYPFGMPLQKVEQKDQTSKKVFVLGVYASAVHARWVGADNKIKIRVLAVASEPEIFWWGEGAEEIIGKIFIPEELGKLMPADAHLNGPSGKTLDEFYLEPLGITRDEAWLSDLLPYARLNSNQVKAIETHYSPFVKKYDLPVCTIPKFSKKELNNEDRPVEILAELKQSQAETLILLGDLPIRWFLSFYTKNQYKKLSDFGETPETYGRKHPIVIDGREYQVIPLVHPRQAGQLGRSSDKWTTLHGQWVQKKKKSVN